MKKETKLKADQFELFDLKIEVESITGNCTCQMSIGDHFFLKGGKLSLPDQSDFCLYAMQSCIPLLPAKQRKGHPADWMETDSQIACPDPACGLIMSINRMESRILNHDDVSANKWDES